MARKSPTGSGEAPLTMWMIARHLATAVHNLFVEGALGGGAWFRTLITGCSLYR